MNYSLYLFLLIICISCSKKEKIENFTDAFLPGKKLAELDNKKLEEVSGLAASISNPQHLWVHNDSGNDPEIYLINEKIDIKLTCKIAHVENRDWEDITIGPGPDAAKNYIYLGDIGDNNAKHKYKYIYRFEEPELSPGSETITITDFDTITFQLPDKKKDTEALWVDYQTKDLYIVSKREEPVYVYQIKYPYNVRDTLVATEVTSLPLTQIVAADLSKDGTKMLMKNYEEIYYWQGDHATIKEMLKQQPLSVPYKKEPQGEAIAWSRDGAGFYTLSEKNLGKKSYLYYYELKK